MIRAGFVWLLGLVVSTGALATDTLSRIQKTGALRLGFRADAPPYSYRSGDGSPSGYVVDLCREISEVIKKSTGAANLKIEFVEVAAASRLETVRDGKVDILCDSTSVTMARRELVDFSIPTFIDGAGLLYRNTGPGHLADFEGKRIGVLQGSTNEEALKAVLYKFDIEAKIVPMKSHEDGVRAIVDKSLDSYFGDRGILSHYLMTSKNQSILKLEEQYYTFETYALAIPRGDGRLRLLVDGALADLYRSHAVRRIYTRSFGNTAPDEFMRALFVIHGVPK